MKIDEIRRLAEDVIRTEGDPTSSYITPDVTRAVVFAAWVAAVAPLLVKLADARGTMEESDAIDALLAAADGRER